METIAASLAWLFGGLLLAFALLVVFGRGPDDTPFVAVMRAVNLVVIRLLHRLKLFDQNGQRIREALPREGPFIVVANHRSGADPNVVGACSRRWISFLMAREYYETSGMEWLFRGLEAIPVNRDGKDLAATRRAMEILRKGRVVGIFPQGGIKEDDDLDVGKAGVALLAAHGKAPVVPFYIAGTPLDESVFKALFFRISKSRVYRGEPIHFEWEGRRPSREDLDGFTQEILRAISGLREVAHGHHATRHLTHHLTLPIAVSDPDTVDAESADRLAPEELAVEKNHGG